MLFALLIGAYLLGSIPFAIVSSRLFGLSDPRSYGSGNPGATNVLRSGNKGAALTTLLGDGMKGWFAVWGATALGFDAGISAVAGLAAFIGHVFSFFLRGKGGKGVATALGVLIGINGWVALAALIAWGGTAYTTRYSSAAALAAAAISPIAGILLIDNAVVIGVLFAISATLAWRHADNIKRLKNGTEGKIGTKKT